MFGMGPQELLVIVVLGLMLFTPRELPKVIKSVARFWGSIRRTAEDFRAAVMEDEELREPIDEIRDAYRGARTELKGAEESARRELAKARMEVRRAERKLHKAAHDEGDSALSQRVSATDTAAAPGDAPPPAPDSGDDASQGAA